MQKVIGVLSVVLVTCLSQGISGATWYVDCSVPASGDGASWESAFKAIQEGIDVASTGDTIIVAPGTYAENVHFNGKNIVLRSTNPLDPEVVGKTIIQGDQNSPAVAFSGTENETCEITGFTITNGRPGILGGNGDRPCHATVRNNAIKGNSGEDGGGLGFCDGTIVNNTITENWAGMRGGGLYDCDGIVMNNRVVGNRSSEYGGGLGECDGTIQNNLIAGNAAWGGAGLYECRGTILNNTIVGNLHSAGGAGLYGIILSCIIWGNNADGSGEQICGSNAPSFIDSYVTNVLSKT